MRDDMPDIDDLRHALAAETADLTVHVPVDRIRRRARGLRVRRATVLTAAVVLAAGAVVAPTVLLSGRSSGPPIGAPPMPTSSCPTPAPAPMPGEIGPLGPFVETGTVLDAPGAGTRYDVLIGLTGTREDPGFVVAFRDRRTGTLLDWDTTVIHRAPDGDFSGKNDSDPTHQFQSSQLVLGPRDVLDVGVYSRAAARITVTSEGEASEAHTAQNAATGWTFFWVRRAAAPLPPDYNTTQDEYQGPERLTLKAYDSAGTLKHSVAGGMFVGLNVQNPRDNQPPNDGGPTPTPGSSTTSPPPAAPATCEPAGTPTATPTSTPTATPTGTRR
jgi:hypothetical protein